MVLLEGDRVCRINDPEWEGTVIGVDYKSSSWFKHGVTTVKVMWDGETEFDIEWTNKLELVEGWEQDDGNS